MKWHNLGLVYKAQPIDWWRQTHAYVPTPVIIDDYIRVFCSFWDKNNVGRIGYVDVDIKDPTKILNISKVPSLDIGSTNSFDSKGVTPISYLFKDEYLIMLYTGWGETKNLPYTLFTGIAISKDKGETFTRTNINPILPATQTELYVRTAAYIKYMPISNEYWIWYVAGSAWFYVNDKLTPTYDLYLIKSKNLLYNWSNSKSKLVLQADRSINEYAIGRPCIIEEAGIFKLFYSSRRYDTGYKLGYAESTDGENWIRKDDKLNMPKSFDKFDSEMQCFSYVLPTSYGTYMFFNGNEHGREGFGVTVLENDNSWV